MKVLLTGATGFIGSSLLPLLLDDGHQVTALVRSDASAAQVAAAGVQPLRGDLVDTGLLTAAAREVDGVVHLASPGDATSGTVDDGVASAFLRGLAGGYGKPYVHTSGLWVHGDTDGPIDESAPMNPPALSAWRPPIDARVRAAEGVRGIVIAPAIVYGHGSGHPRLLVDGPRTAGDRSALLYPGTGDQHWTTVFVEDLAALYARALTGAAPGAYYLGASGQNPTVRALAEAASRAAGLDGRTAPEPPADTRSRLGPLTDAFALDQQATGAKARADLGWRPTGPSMLDELETGSYAPRPASSRPAAASGGGRR